MTQFSNFFFKNVICFLKNMLIEIKVFFFLGIFSDVLLMAFMPFFWRGVGVVDKIQEIVKGERTQYWIGFLFDCCFKLWKNESLVLFDKIW